MIQYKYQNNLLTYMYKKTLILVILAVLFAVCTAGCISNDDPQITPGPSEEIPEPSSFNRDNRKQTKKATTQQEATKLVPMRHGR